MNEHSLYLKQLYPMQDQVLKALSTIETGLYLTGGTALSRGYLNHRYSDDLDFFVNDDNHFPLWADRFIQALSQSTSWDLRIDQREERYVRLNLAKSDTYLKIEMINDVPSRVGTPWHHPTLGLLDTAKNILANKITAAINREAAKDLADIWGLCYQMNLSLENAITGAQGKAAGIFPVDLARILCSVQYADWEVIKWIDAPDPESYIKQLDELGKRLILLK